MNPTLPPSIPTNHSPTQHHHSTLAPNQTAEPQTAPHPHKRRASIDHSHQSSYSMTQRQHTQQKRQTIHLNQAHLHREQSPASRLHSRMLLLKHTCLQLHQRLPDLQLINPSDDTKYPLITKERSYTSSTVMNDTLQILKRLHKHPERSIPSSEYQRLHTELSTHFDSKMIHKIKAQMGHPQVIDLLDRVLTERSNQLQADRELLSFFFETIVINRGGLAPEPPNDQYATFLQNTLYNSSSTSKITGALDSSVREYYVQQIASFFETRGYL